MERDLVDRETLEERFKEGETFKVNRDNLEEVQDRIRLALGFKGGKLRMIGSEPAMSDEMDNRINYQGCNTVGKYQLDLYLDGYPPVVLKTRNGVGNEVEISAPYAPDRRAVRVHHKDYGRVILMPEEIVNKSEEADSVETPV